ncbi:hypothetical protein BDV98DRAFT_576505 [Pterulicium gracile]|uniref:Uncharacterized protein n=1 Tax=Pterulicium gracile TaxID=1884261 RepID=A0A5C3Q3S4_9AGAR|nr:hypothetical protein BDV98DRAFT_576505 [Pterula gracilis]
MTSDFSWTDNVQALVASCLPKSAHRASGSNVRLGDDDAASMVDLGESTGSTPTGRPRKSMTLCGWDMFGRRRGAIHLGDSDEEQGLTSTDDGTISLFGRSTRRSRRRSHRREEGENGTTSQPRAKRAPDSHRTRTISATSNSTSNSEPGGHTEDVDSDADAPILDSSNIEVRLAEDARRKEEEAVRKEEKRQRKQTRKLAKVLARTGQQPSMDGDDFEGFQGSGPIKPPRLHLQHPTGSSHLSSPISPPSQASSDGQYPHIPSFLPPHALPYSPGSDTSGFIHVDSAQNAGDEDDDDADLGGAVYSLSSAQKRPYGQSQSRGSGSDSRASSSHRHAPSVTSPLAMEGQQLLQTEEKKKKKKKKTKSSTSHSTSTSTSASSRSKSKSRSHVPHPSLSASSNTTSSTFSSLASLTHTQNQHFVPSVVEEEMDYDIGIDEIEYARAMGMKMRGDEDGVGKMLVDGGNMRGVEDGKGGKVVEEERFPSAGFGRAGGARGGAFLANR